MDHSPKRLKCVFLPETESQLTDTAPNPHVFFPFPANNSSPRQCSVTHTCYRICSSFFESAGNGTAILQRLERSGGRSTWMLGTSSDCLLHVSHNCYALLAHSEACGVCALDLAALWTCSSVILIRQKGAIDFTVMAVVTRISCIWQSKVLCCYMMYNYQCANVHV